MSIERHRFSIEVQQACNGQMRHVLRDQGLNLLCSRLSGLLHLLFFPLPSRSQIAYCQGRRRRSGCRDKANRPQGLTMMRKDAFGHL
jgi:hypothetical protein